MPDPTTAGPAFRVSVLGEQQSEAYEMVYVQLDAANCVVHVFSADAQIHYLTIPIQRVLVEWLDPSALEPQVRMPPFGAGAFERMGEQVQRMADGMGRALGQG
jgi:hypothetical protein